MHKRRLRLPRDDVRESGTGAARTLAGLRTGSSGGERLPRHKHDSALPTAAFPTAVSAGNEHLRDERESDIDQHSDKRVLREPEGRGVAAKSRV